MGSLLGQRRACLSCKHKNTDQDPIATKASKRNVKLARVGKRETKGGREVKTGQWDKGTKAMGFLQRRLLHHV